VISRVRREAEELGRDPSAIEMTGGGARTVAQAESLAAVGIDRLVIAVRAKTADAVEDELLGFGETVIKATADL
jgi:hypothetical protein